MKKSVVFILLLLLGIGSLSAQDQIITKSGDTINCKIIVLKATYITYLTRANELISQKTIQMPQVSTFTNNYYTENIITDEDIQQSRAQKNIRIAFNSGFSYLTAKVASELSTDARDHVKKLKTGWNAGLEFDYFFNEKWGAGIKYAQFMSKASSDEVSVFADGFETRVDVDEDLTIKYWGPSLVTRHVPMTNPNVVSVFGLSLGLLDYVDKVDMENVRFSMLGKAPAFNYYYAFDYKVNKDIYLGFSFNYYLGSLTQVTYEDSFTTETIDLEPENNENISRFDISVAIRF